MRNLTNEAMFSTGIKLKDKIDLLLNHPTTYGANSIEDIKLNAHKTKCPFYKTTKKRFNNESIKKSSPYCYYFSEGAYIVAHNLWADLVQDSEYKYHLNIRDTKDSIDINIFDWNKSIMDIQEEAKEYNKKNPIFNKYIQNVSLENIQAGTPVYEEAMEKMEQYLQGMEKIVSLPEKNLDGLMPPFMYKRMEEVKSDFSKTQQIGAIAIFHSHKDNKPYLSHYNLNKVRTTAKGSKKKAKKEAFDWIHDGIPSFT